MFATFAPTILWFAHTIAAFAPMIAAFALGIFSKTHQSSLSINGGIFSKITPSLFTIKEGSTSFPKPLFSWRRLAALGNMKANFHCAHLHNLSPQGTGDVPTALSIVFTTPSLPLVGDRNGAQTATLYGWRTIRGLRQQSCGFLCGDEPALRRPLDMNYPHNYNMLVIYQIIDTIWG